MGKHAAPHSTKIPLVLQLAWRVLQVYGVIAELVDLVDWAHRIV